MRRFLKFFARLSALLLGLSLCISPLGGFAAYDFEYEQAVGNPLKGFMPFYKQGGAADGLRAGGEDYLPPQGVHKARRRLHEQKDMHRILPAERI